MNIWCCFNYYQRNGNKNLDGQTIETMFQVIQKPNNSQCLSSPSEPPSALPLTQLLIVLYGLSIYMAKG